MPSIAPPLLNRLLHRLNGLFARSDLPPRVPAAGRAEEPSFAASAAVPEPESAHRAPIDHLGAYAPLVDAIRDELGHFVASHVRLHLAIAERDRFLLTAIAVRSDGDAEARRLLQRFCREFRPEQLKRFLAREVVAGLPNADAIDLSRFEGLVDGDAPRAGDGKRAEAGEYAELLALLAVEGDGPDASAWRIDVLGRWVAEDDAPARERVPSARPSIRPAEAPRTPLAGQRQELEVEDAGGRRRIVLQGVVPGRRYAIGTGDGADIRIDGTYASRRHAELWLDGGRWHVADAGSTNGVRLEARSAVLDPAAPVDVVGPGLPARLDAHRRIVLSARAEGPAGDYPTLALVATEHGFAEPRRGVEPPVTPPTPLSPPATLAVAPTAPLDTRVADRSAATTAGASAPHDVPGEGATDTRQAPLASAAAAADDETVAVAARGSVEPAQGTIPRTPRTAVLPRPALSALADADEPVESLPPLPPGAFRLTLSQSGGIRTVDLDAGSLPVSIGRSRTCTIAVDRRHESVSGRHLEIVALDDAGATVAVLGDNGIAIETVRHGPAAASPTVLWPWGAICELAPAAMPSGEPACSLLLTRAWEA